MRGAFLFTCALASSVALAADAAQDFSATTNPNGVWSYGYATSLTGTFIPYTLQLTGTPVAGWGAFTSGDGNPSILKNFSGSSFSFGTVSWNPNQLTMHSGINGEYSVLRYTSSAAGLFDITASFEGRDTTSTDVHLVVNGAAVWSGNVNGFLSTAGTQQSLNLIAGDILELRVGPGGNGFAFDTTGVNLTVVPEPGTLIALGLIGLAARRRNRKA